MEEKDIHKEHRKRLREWFDKDPGGFTKHELLELLLFYAIPRRNVNPVAHKLLAKYGSVKNVLRAYFQERFGDRIKIVTSGNIWIDFIAPNANKGSALSNIVSSLGMNPKNGITFGDQYNDLEMLQLSNISYAMTTAATGVADYATHTTDSVEKTLKDLLKNL